MPVSEQEYQEAQATITQYQADQAAEQRVRQDAYYAPTAEIVHSAEYREVRQALTGLRNDAVADQRLSFHVDALVLIMERLANEVAQYAPQGAAVTPLAPQQ